MAHTTTSPIKFSDFELISGSELITARETSWQLSGANDSTWLLRHELAAPDYFRDHAEISLYVFKDGIVINRSGQFFLERHPDYTTGIKIHATEEKPESWQDALLLVLSQSQTPISVERGSLEEMEALLTIIASQQAEILEYDTGYTDRDGSIIEPKVTCGWEGDTAERIPTAIHILRWFNPRGSAPNRTNYADDRRSIEGDCNPAPSYSFHDHIADINRIAKFYEMAGRDLGLTAADITALLAKLSSDGASTDP